MRLLKHPGLWVALVIVAFTFTIGGRQNEHFTTDLNLAEHTTSPGAHSPSMDGDASVTNDIPDDVPLAEGSARIKNVDNNTADNSARPDSSHAMQQSTQPDRTAHLPSPDPLDAIDVGGPTDEEAAMVMAHVATSDQELPVVFTHVVQKGETLSAIASRYGIDTNTILASNDIIDTNRLLVGQRLNILSIPGALHSVRSGESLWVISRVYNTDIDSIAKINEIDDPGRIRPEQQLVIPGKEAANIANALRSEAVLSSDGKLLRAFSWPVTGRISSRYGPRWGTIHHGIDIAVGTGTPVRAAANGRVTFAGWNGGYGNLVTIDHGNRVETRYAHNSRLMVKVGDVVSRGTVVAYSGNTGNSTGPHVHFEIRLRGQSYDPMNYLR